MNEKRFPLPKKYWIYIILIITSYILLLFNVQRTDSWTGDKPFSEFMERDWNLFYIFLFEEFLLWLFSLFCTIRACKIGKERRRKIQQQWMENKYAGIKPSEYDYIWYDFECTERALILKQGNCYKLSVHEYDEQTGNWEVLVSDGVYSDLEEIKKALYYDFDFFCAENAELDKYGDESYKSTVHDIPPINDITNALYDKQLTFTDYEVVKVIYNTDKTKRFIILKSTNGFYKYTYEEICVFDEDEWKYCCNIDNAYPAFWASRDKSSACSFFGTENEALVSMKQESEYILHFDKESDSMI